ncbi:MAG: DNA adenine methylase [Deltaproteobacteria bacterium]|nr:DNA adenine methylase [Deltaproteobacteria bacterium]
MFDIQNRAKPVLKWAGGKSGQLSQMISLFPTDFKRFVEPFLGGGAVFLALDGCDTSVLNDYDSELVNLYTVIRDDPEGLMGSLDSMTPHYSEVFYYRVRANVPLDPVGQAARTVFLNKTGFNGLYRKNSRGEFNSPFGKRPQCPALYNRKNLLGVSHRLQSSVLLNADFEEILNNTVQGDFVYCDPPYEPLSPTSSFNGYTGNGFSRADQTRLMEACGRAVNRGAWVAVSNSSSPFIARLYQKWETRQIFSRRMINCKGDSRGEVNEILVLFDPDKNEKGSMTWPVEKQPRQAELCL